MNRSRSEHSANTELAENAVRYSESWMRPSRHVYRYKRIGFLARLIRWIAGH